MPTFRLAFALPLVMTLAACGGGDPQPTATPAAPSQPTTTAAAPTPTPTPAAAPASTPAATPATATSEALAPLVGNWAADLANCGSNLSIAISEAEFRGAENTCGITGWTDNGDGSFTAAMTCTAEGQETSERIRMNPVFAPTGEGITLSYLDRGGDDVTVLRCAAPRSE